jgi:hypothetical protein
MRALAAAALLLAGCNGATEGPATGPGREGNPATAQQVGTEPARADRPPPGPPPVVRVRGEPGRDRSVAVSIESRGERPAELSRRVVIEQREGETFRPVGNLALRDSCNGSVPDGCVTLVPGAELRPPEWLGLLGDAQCACERCAAAPAGVYRFVATSCDGAHRVESAPFELR